MKDHASLSSWVFQCGEAELCDYEPEIFWCVHIPSATVFFRTLLCHHGWS